MPPRKRQPRAPVAEPADDEPAPAPLVYTRTRPCPRCSYELPVARAAVEGALCFVCDPVPKAVKS
jgi:hypothetical protein